MGGIHQIRICLQPWKFEIPHTSRILVVLMQTILDPEYLENRLSFVDSVGFPGSTYVVQLNRIL